MTGPISNNSGANAGGQNTPAPAGQGPLNAQNLVDPTQTSSTGQSTNSAGMSTTSLNSLMSPPPLKTFVYAPQVRIIVAHNGLEYDVSNDVVRCNLSRPENSAATLTFTLHNKGLRYTPQGLNPFFSRMDRVVVYFKKTTWLQVFSGYLDMVPYKQLYAGPVDFKATCTIKRLMHTWWDPALPQSSSLLNQITTPEYMNGLTTDGMGANDSGLGSMLRRIMVDVGGWNSANIHIQNFPTSFLQFMMTQVAALQTSGAPDVLSFQQMLLGSDTTPGPGAYAGSNPNAGPPGPTTPTGTGAAGTGLAFYVSQIVAACDQRGLGPSVQDNTVAASLSQAGVTGESGTNSLFNPGTQQAWSQVQQLGQTISSSNRNSDGAILGVACAMAETGGGVTIRNLYNPAVSGSESYPNDGPGTDGTSVGIFQQQNQGWGTLPQRMNPMQAAGMFFTALANINWRNMDPGQAIQQVQQSGNAAGAQYDAAIAAATTAVQAYRTSKAGTVSTALPGGSATVGGTTIPAAASAAGAAAGGSGGAASQIAGLVTGAATVSPAPASLASAVNPVRQAKPQPDSEGAINFARSVIGLPYIWGGTGPAGYDCLEGGTLVAAERGLVPIEELTTSDRVLTRQGYRRVLRAWKVRDAEVIRVNFEGGKFLVGTPDHRVWTENRGWVPLMGLNEFDTVVLCQEGSEKASVSSVDQTFRHVIPNNECADALVPTGFGSLSTPTLLRELSSKASLTTAIPTQAILHTAPISSAPSSPYMLQSGSTTTVDLSHQDMRYTISTTTLSTTRQKILNWSRFQNIVGKVRRIVGCTTTPARGVRLNSRRIKHLVAREDSAARNTNRSTTTIVPVYDVMVEGVHEFFANGILVHNCSGLVSQAFKSIGVATGRTTQDIATTVPRVANTSVQRGDLVEPSQHHVVLWLGDGTIIEAQQTGVPIHQVAASTIGPPSQWSGVYRACPNGGPDPTAPFNPPATMGPGTPPSATYQVAGVNGTGTSGSAEGIARNQFSYLFTNQFASSTTALFSGTRAFIEGQPLIQMVAAICAAGLRCWSSAPNGDFMAWYPDYWGLDGKPAVLRLADIELKDFHINFSDEPLTTHVYINGEAVTGGTGAISDPTEAWLMSAGVATVEQPWLYARLIQVAPGDLESANGQEIMHRFGVRPLQQTYAMAGTTQMEFLLACQVFMEQWAKQYQTTVQMTFMPEIFPGMRVELPDRNLQIYVNDVNHSCDYEQGFQTSVSISAPSNPQARALMSSVNTAVDPNQELPQTPGSIPVAP